MMKQTNKLLAIKNDIRLKIKEFNSECTGCMICMDNCSMHISHEINPLNFTTAILDIGKIDIEKIYSCNGCNGCNSPCPKNLNFAKLILEIKRFSFKENENIPINKNGYKSIKFHQYFSSSKFFVSDNHNFQHSMDNKMSLKTAFFPGCSLSAINPELPMQIYDFLKVIYPSITVINQCCSNPLESIGDQDNFSLKFTGLKSKIIELNIDELIVSCPNCYKMFCKYLKDLKLKITFISEILAQPNSLILLTDNFADEITQSISQLNSTNRPIVIHDPCPLREYDLIHNSIRTILDHLELDYTELKFNKKNTICCGSGAMLKSISNQSFKNYKDHIDSLFPSNSILVSYCNECVENFNVDPMVSSVHILNLIFNTKRPKSTSWILDSPSVLAGIFHPQLKKTDLLDNKPVSLINKWHNRYKYNKSL